MARTKLVRSIQYLLAREARVSDSRSPFERGRMRRLTITRGDNATTGFLGDATMLTAVKRVLVEEEGQDLIEYALLAAFIALAAVAAITQLGTAINNIYTRISSTVDSAGS